jgi:hypothetical protein
VKNTRTCHLHPYLPSTKLLHTHTYFPHEIVRTHLPKGEMREERVRVELGFVSILTPSSCIYWQGSPQFREPKHHIAHSITLGGPMESCLAKAYGERCQSSFDRSKGSVEPFFASFALCSSCGPL